MRIRWNSRTVHCGVRTLRARRQWFSLVMYGLLATAAVTTLLLPINRSYGRTLMETRHLRGSSFAGWATLQLLPTMYNFANRAWMSDHLLNEADRHAARPAGRRGANFFPADGRLNPAVTQWINHFPTRLITFGFLRGKLREQERPTYFCFESRYRGQTVLTHYVARSTGNGLSIEPLEPTEAE